VAVADDTQIAQWAHELADAPAADVLAWAAGRFGPRVAMATGFGAEGCVLIHLIGTSRLPVDIFTIDTGLLFQETYQLWWTLERKYDLHIRGVEPRLSLGAQAAAHGPALWASDPDRCCALRKVQPLDVERGRLDAWISAVRHDQTEARADTAVVERDPASGLVKVNPIARWTHDQVWSFIRANDVPYNPLHDRGYPSIGCEPCTTPVAEGESPRAGRWRGREKTECGIHLGRVSVPATFFATRPEGARRAE
jgi:phosphoadenylyl-sulfate reductase (thioredoxin)